MMSEAIPIQTFSLRDLLGEGYDEWYFNLDPSTEIFKNGMSKSEWAKSVRYWCVKGSRNSKKSYTIAYWIIINMMHYKWANTLVVRKVDKTLRNSCYALLKKCMANLGVLNKWKCNESTLTMTYLPTGQKILFSGLDDSQKLSSLQVEHGFMTWLWVEEAYQINSEEEFDKLDQSFRGKLPDGAFIRIMVSLNPWNRTHWIRTKFFETEEGKPLDDPDIYAHTTNYLINEWASEADIKFFERMKRLNPRQYDVAGLGKWGSPEGLIYDGNWEEFEFDVNAVARREGVVAINGLDFGFSADPTAMACMLYDEKHYELYIYDELYVKGYTSKMRYDAICNMGHKKSLIYYDSAGALDSAELMELGLSNMVPYNKAGEKNSILNGINNLRSLKIYIHPKCVNTLIEIENYMWYVDNNGVTQPKPQPGSMDHIMDACIRKGTMVTTINGKIPIEDIRVGDKVLTHYGYQSVLSAGKTGYKRIWKLILSNGTGLEATDNHPIMTSEGFIRVDNLKSGMKVSVWNPPTDREAWFPLLENDAKESEYESCFMFMFRTRSNIELSPSYLWEPILVDVVDCYVTDEYDDVYNLEVENSHTYLANDVMVHNCRYGFMGYKQSSSGGFIGESGEDDWKKDYQYDLMDEEEIAQRKRDVGISDKSEKEEEPDEEEGGWCFST